MKHKASSDDLADVTHFNRNRGAQGHNETSKSIQKPVKAPWRNTQNTTRSQSQSQEAKFTGKAKVRTKANANAKAEATQL